MDDECRGVRQRKKQADPTCCPVCGITVRAHEMDQHYAMEMDRLNKLSTQKNRKFHTKDALPSPSHSSTASASTSTTNEAATAVDDKNCWSIFQRIKNNRTARLKVSSAPTIEESFFKKRLILCKHFSNSPPFF